VIWKKRNETVIVKREEYEGKDTVIIENIENCDIFIPFIMNNLYIKNTYHSRIYSGYVLGTAYVETTSKSNYQIYCTFLKVLKANECVFHIASKMAPIIEECIWLEFGPCMFDYRNRALDEIGSGFDEFREELSKIDWVIDNWWKEAGPSTNGSVMSEEKISYLTKVGLPGF